MHKKNVVTHIMTRKKGVFVCIRHDDVRDGQHAQGGLPRRHYRSNTATPLTVNTSNTGQIIFHMKYAFEVRKHQAFMNICIFNQMTARHRELHLEAVDAFTHD